MPPEFGSAAIVMISQVIAPLAVFLDAPVRLHLHQPGVRIGSLELVVRSEKSLHGLHGPVFPGNKRHPLPSDTVRFSALDESFLGSVPEVLLIV